MTGPTREPLPVPVPKEALDYLRAKGYRVGFDHRDVFQEEHATAWTVAKAMRLDILEAIRAAVDEAIEGGMTFAAFKRDLQPCNTEVGLVGPWRTARPLTGETRSAAGQPAPP
ncbi:phage head morphogenesis protein [Ectopseudomonas oleovorans]|uniref:phage head morphogenesis protein n=1 Tax=Ectopseudomonas oleovorans TaxID=301 RepID=UPI003F1D04D4